MLLKEASSFGRQARLALGLSWVAGYTNVVLLAVSGQTISHQTGNTTHLGKALGEWLAGAAGGKADVQIFALVIALFWAGALTSGLLINLAPLRHRPSRYVLPMGLETVLLCLLTLGLTGRFTIPLPALAGLAAFAMGLQNATITRISGAVVRTTHLTGVFTDLGLETAQLLMHRLDRARPAGDPRRVALLGGIAASFLFGAILGTALLRQAGPGVLMLPVTFLAILVLRSAYTWRHNRGTVGPQPR